MLDKVLFARGVLVPMKPENVTEDTAEAIRKALAEQDLWWIAAIFDADEGLQIQSGVTVETEDLPERATSYWRAQRHSRAFAVAIRSFIQSEGIKDLDFEGSLFITVDTDDEMYVSRVNIENSEILFQEAGLNWGFETPLLG